MSHRSRVRPIVTTLTLLVSLAGGGPLLGTPDGSEEAVQRALRLLPKQPEKIEIVDDGQGGVDAFVRSGKRIVYVRRAGDTLRHAARGPGVFDYVLAVTIWHEMAHLDGADEGEAQRREEQLWTQYVVEGRIDRERGLRYLRLLAKRRQSRLP
jgi:hypothetical protein